MAAAWILPLFTSLISLLLGYEEANIVFAGDAMQHQAQLDAARKAGTYNYDGYFDAIKPIVSVADYAVVNLETPVGPAPHTGYPCFNAPEAFVDALADAGFDMFLTANNHTLDRHAKGLRSTIEVLDSRSLDHTGTFADEASRKKLSPLIADINGFKIAFLNYTYGTNGIQARDGVAVNYIDRAAIKADVDSARAAKAELICVCIHWGDEYKLLPNRQQRNLADFLEALGVDMIVGAHPHVIQPMEFRPNRYYPDKNVALIYSLGNFVSNMKTRDTRGGSMAHVQLIRSADGKPSVKSLSYRLVFTEPPSAHNSNFRVVEPDSIHSGVWKQHADAFAKSARSIFEKHNINVDAASTVFGD